MNPCCLLHFLATQLLSVGVGLLSQALSHGWYFYLLHGEGCHSAVRMMVCHTTFSKEVEPCNSLLTGLPFLPLKNC